MEQESFSAEELLPDELVEPVTIEDAKLKAVLEAIIYVTDEPLSLDQICAGLELPRERIMEVLEQLANDYERSDRGLTIREVAGGFKMSTKPEHHEAVRRFVKNLNPPLKLSLPALETLAVIAYKQPITAPEIMEIRGVQGAGVLKTLLDRKLIGTAGRKQVVGKPILYKTTREFLVQFGLKDVGELPSLKEFQDLASSEIPPLAEPAPPATVPETAPPFQEGTADLRTAESPVEAPAAEEPTTVEEPPVEEPTVEEAAAEQPTPQELTAQESPAEEPAAQVPDSQEPSA
jgi:segregation and condensation protein B